MSPQPLYSAPAREGYRIVPLPSKSDMLAGYSDLLSVKDMREITGVSEQTIRKEIAEGRLPGCKIGRRLFVPKCRLIEFAMGGDGHGAA